MALRLRGATSGYTELKAPASAGDNTLTLPTNNGSSNQLLKTDGNGNLSWTDDNSGVSLSGSTNNTIATVTGANALQGEANLIFDGTTLTASTDIKVQGGSGDTTFILHRTNAAGGNDNSFGNVRFTDNNNNEVAGIRGCRHSAVDDAYLQFLTRSTGGSITERLRLSPTNDIATFTGSNSGTLTFRNDTSNEMQIHSGGSDALIFGTGGENERLRITSSGKIGIGLTAPTAKVAIVGGTASIPRLAFESGTDDNDFTFSQYEDVNGVYTLLGQNLKLDSNGNNTILDTNHKTAGIHFDGRSHGALFFITGDTNAQAERLRITKDGMMEMRSEMSTAGSQNIFRFTDTDTSVAAGQSMGRIQWYSSDASGAGACVKAEIEAACQDTTPDGYIAFKTQDGSGTTAPAERMRLMSAGSLYHGCTTAPDTDDPGSAFMADANQGQLRIATNSSGSAVLCVFYNANGNVGDIRTNASATSYNTSSDYRLKENEVAISDGITRLKTLKPYRFNFKADSSKIVDGFFAHEVTAVPEAITGEKDGTEMQVIDQSKLVPLLTAALQEAIGKIETLETKVAALESA